MKKRMGVGIVVALALMIAVVGALRASNLVDALRGQEDSVQEIITLIDKGDDEGALALLNSLHAAIIETRAEILGWSFSGEANMLTDPFVLPEGVYRVHFTTEGFGIVETIVLDGADRESTLFTVSQGDAAGGASTVYRSKGGRIMIQFSVISAPYKLVFEQIE